jgi:hypothetical protein
MLAIVNSLEMDLPGFDEPTCLGIQSDLNKGLMKERGSGPLDFIIGKRRGLFLKTPHCVGFRSQGR